MNTQFKKGVLEICILSVVSEEEMYGFEIISKLSNLLNVNENTIYPILRRLTVQNYFETYEKESPFGAKRKYYKVTNLGREKLNEYIMEWQDFSTTVNNILEGRLK